MFEKALHHQSAFCAPEDFYIDTEFGPYRRTLLHLTTDCYDETVDSMVKYLIDKNANQEAVDEFGTTPLDLACKQQNFRCAIALIKKGACVNDDQLHVFISGLKTKSRDGLIPDELQFGHLRRQLFSMIISENRRVLTNLDDGHTPLMRAAYDGETSTVQLLLESTTDVDYCGHENETALMRAVDGKNADCVELLINCGADVNLPDVDGQSAACRLPVDSFDPRWSRIWVLFLERGCDLVSTYWKPDVGTAVSFLQHAVYQALKGDDLLLDLIVRHGTAIGLLEIDEVSEALETVNYDPQRFVKHGFCEGNIDDLLYRGHAGHDAQDLTKPALLQLQQNIKEHFVTVVHK
ncbi:uncharacterized protein FMAN_14167 [Fusarium mangiferae]|uniref:Uncharacterized protein n=1 Tax=Fusarium mangiferae TaxID=192010 RepID=A0A1L7UBT9_FUSMA|nr:uncharacterized protein FMAN_14167 [Fusarium mangiferae]CVL08188.1 uncharacterized protein FMAN_14167 [Fusarium mangiferae]